MKSMIAVLLSIFVLVAFSGMAFLGGQWTARATVTSQGPTIEEIRSLAELVTTQITVSDVLTGEEQGYEGSWLVKGDVMLGIDLNNVEILKKDEKNHTAEIVLPPPHVVMARVDHERTMTWDVKRVTWNLLKWDESPLRDTAMQHAQELIEHMGKSQSTNLLAKKHAEQVIESLYKMVGWSVSVRWQ